MIKLIIKNPDGSQTTKEITQDTTLSPSKGQQFYFDNADGSREYTLNLAEGEESVELIFSGNGERLVLNLEGMAELIKQSDNAINENTKTVLGIMDDNDGMKELNETVLNNDFQGDKVITDLKELLSDTTNPDEDYQNGIIIDDFGSLLEKLDAAAAGGELGQNSASADAIVDPSGQVYGVDARGRGVTVDPNDPNGEIDSGENNTPTITGDVGTVFEANIAAGTDIYEGTFNIQSPDGISSVTIGGRVFTVAQLSATNTTPSSEINTGEGLLFITGYNEISPGVAEVSYKYDLITNLDHDDELADGDATNNDVNTISDFIAISVQDPDGDTATGQLQINIIDDVPTIDVGLGEGDGISLRTQDADTIGAASDTATASFAFNFTLNQEMGADDAGTPASLTYTFSVTNAVSGLTSNGEAITLSVNASGVIEGTTPTGGVIFTVAVNATTGEVTLTQNEVIDHDDELADGDATNNDVNNLGLVAGNIILTASATIVDGDGDTASDSQDLDISTSISFDDDIPTIYVYTDEESAPTPDLIVDETDLSINASADFSSLFISDLDAGADGKDASLSSSKYTLDVKADGSDSGLIDVATGEKVLLTDNNGVVEGRTETGGLLVFTVSVNEATGEVTLDQIRALTHPNATDPDDEVSLARYDLVTLTKTEVLVDNDGDKAEGSATLRIGKSLIFNDDGPTVEPKEGATADVDLDETTDATAGTGLGVAATISATDISGLFNTPEYGADGAGKIEYSLSATPLTATGLFLSGADQTVASNEIKLVETTDGYAGYVNGDTTTTAVFTVEIDSATGKVTVTQNAAMEHSDDGSTAVDHNDTNTPLDLDGLIKVEQKITDRDGDTDTATSESALDIEFYDDGPSAGLTGEVETAQTNANNVELTVDETEGTQTGADATVAGEATADFTKMFLSTDSSTVSGFKDADYGTDGAGSVAYALSITNITTGTALSSLASGLYALDNTDTSTTDGDGFGKGEEIIMTVNAAGDIEGKTTNGDIYFTISNNGAEVTFTQNDNIWHPVAGSTAAAHDDPASIALAKLGDAENDVSIELTQTITDADGDTDSATVSLVSSKDSEDVAKFTIEDDGPDAKLTGEVETAQTNANNVELTVDETEGTQTGADATVAGEATADFTKMFLSTDSSTVSGFKDADYGTDGAGSVAYALSITNITTGTALSSLASGLYALDNTDTSTTDGDGFGKGEEIIMTVNAAGDIEGKTTNGDIYFTISNNGAEVTFTQNDNIWHPVAGSTAAAHDDPASIALAKLGDAENDVSIELTQTITDADGDTDSATVSLVSSKDSEDVAKFTIEDDGPDAKLTGEVETAQTNANNVELTVDETEGTQTGADATVAGEATADFTKMFLSTDSSTVSGFKDADYGTDGAGSVAYALSITNITTGTALSSLASGLYALDNTDTSTTDGDGFGKGEEIIMTVNAAGDIEGKTTNGDIYFTISNNGAEVTFTQNDNIWHPVAGSTAAAHDDPASIALAKLGDAENDVSIELTQTITDADGDTDSATVSLVSSKDSEDVAKFTIEDDGPDAKLTGEVETAQTNANNVELTVDETEGTQTGADATVAGEATADFTKMFLSTDSSTVSGFKDADYGTDGAGSVAYALSITNITTGTALSSLASGLYALDNTDTSTTDGDGFGKGEEIIMTVNAAGDIEGKTTNGDIYFTISNNGAEVTFTQNDNIWHPVAGSTAAAHDDPASIALAKLGDAENDVSIELTQTITDADGDTDSATVSLVSSKDSEDVAKFTIEDDGPDAKLTGEVETAQTNANNVELTVDETEGTQTGADATVAGEATADFTKMFLSTDSSTVSGFKDADYGTDGAGSVAYALSITNITTGTALSSLASGLYALDNTDTSTTDGDGFGKGEEIIMTVNAAGDIEGKTTNGDIYFTISNNGAEVTFTQNDNIWHPVAGSTAAAHDDPASIALAKLGDAENDVSIELTQTITDADGDTDSATVSLVSSKDSEDVAKFTIEDDGPTASKPDITLLESNQFTITNHDAVSSAGYHNSYGYYLKDPVTGEPTTGVIVWDDVHDTDTVPVTVTGYTQDQVGFFIIPNGENKNTGLDDNTEVTFVKNADGQWQAEITSTGTPIVGQGSHVLFDEDTLNKDNQDHVEDNALIGNQNWEDLQIPNGDGDFNDVNVNVKWTNSAILDESELPSIDDGVYSATVDVSAAFSGTAAGSYGTDGAGTTTFDLELNLTSPATNVGSGLYILDNTKVDGKGAEILLVDNGNGTVSGMDGTEKVFTISIDNNRGVLTIAYDDQVDPANIWNANTTDSDDASVLQTTIANTLVVTQTITDADGDSATSDGLDVGNGKFFKIEDDGPTANLDATVVDDAQDNNITLAVDESAGQQTNPTDNVSANSSKADFSNMFKTIIINGNASVDYGTDGAGSVAYSLNLTNSTGSILTLGSGLYALDASDAIDTDGDGIGQGNEIIMTVNSITGDIEGKANGEVYFTISNNGTEVTFTQTKNIWHGIAGDDSNSEHNDAAGIALSQLNNDDVSIVLTQTVTDADGDTDTASVKLVSSEDTEDVAQFNILDDGPSVDVTANPEVRTLILEESFENFRTNDGWQVEHGGGDINGQDNSTDTTITGDHGVVWDLNSEGVEIQKNIVTTSDDGSSHAELDPHDFDGQDGNTVMTTPVTLIGSDSYELSFAYQPRPSDKESSDMKVTFGGKELTIDSDSNGVLTITTNPSDNTVQYTTTTDANGWTTIDVVYSGITGSTADLTFEGLADSNKLGALIDDISLTGVSGGVEPTLVVDETNLNIDDSASFAGLFSATKDAGTDGEQSHDIDYSLDVKSSNVDSGLVDTATGDNVLLKVDAGQVVGYVTIAGVETTVFTVSVDSTGNVTLDQQRAVVHPDATNHDDAVNLSADDLVTLTRTDIVTDNDGDTATDSDTISIGANLTFKDDGPSIDAVANNESLVTLTTQDAQTEGAAFDTDTTSANFGGVFASTGANYGADGAGNIDVDNYNLSVKDATSGLTSAGVAITLSLVNGEVVGKAGTTDVFKVSVASDGKVTLTQYEVIDHPNTNSNSEIISLVNGKVELSADVTITDKDGDTASDTAIVDLGGNLRFQDDGPVIDIDKTTATEPTLTVDETDLTTNDSASFASLFTVVTSDAGADGEDTSKSSIKYTLDVKAANADTGLLDISSGEKVLLTENASGIIEGRTETTNELVFTVSVDESTGNVTLDQVRALTHPDATNPNDEVSLTADDLVTLTRTDVLVDNDGDTDSDSVSIDIGKNLLFKDDAPLIDIDKTAVTEPKLTVDETDLTINDSASFASLFTVVTSDAGADGEDTSKASTKYTLDVKAANADSGLVDVKTGEKVVLTENASGVIEGRTETGGLLVFTVAVNEATAEVTLDQVRAVDHPDATNPDDVVSLKADDLVTLTRTDVLVDNDGDTDTDSESIDIGKNLLFKDDGPSVDISSRDDSRVILRTDDVDTKGSNSDTDTSSYNFGQTFQSSPGSITGGADGTAKTEYEYKLSAVDGTDSGLTSQGVTIVLNVVNGEVIGTAGSTEIFKVSVVESGNDAGNVTLTQNETIDHVDENADNDATNNDANLATLVDNLIKLSAIVTVTDKDGDTASDTETINIGSNLQFTDDTPSSSDSSTSLDATSGPVNLVFTLDISGSMGSGVSGTGQDRLEVAIEAMEELVAKYESLGSEVLIQVNTFNATASGDGSWMTPSQLETFLNGLNHSGLTNYEDALEETEDNYSLSPNGGDTYVYFLSDGNPTTEINDGAAEESGYLDSARVADWNGFVNNSVNEIDKVFSIGIGSSVSTTYLAQVSANYLEVADPSKLSETLQGTVVTSTGSLTFDFGADGAADGTGVKLDAGKLAFTWGDDDSTNGLSEITTTGTNAAITWTITDGAVLVGTINGETVIKVEATGINTANPEYSISQFDKDAGITGLTIPFTVTDGDGDSSTSNLNVSVDSSPTVLGDTNTVYESGLNPNGTEAATNKEMTTGTFNITSPDGIATVTIGGEVFTEAQLIATNTTPKVIDTVEGSLVITGFNTTTGDVSYEYTLIATIDNDSKPGATGTEFIDNITLELEDTDGDTTSGTLKITIVDDVPVAEDDLTTTLVEDAATTKVEGQVLTNDNSGADAPKDFVSWDIANDPDIAELNTYGTLKLNADGTYEFVLDNTLPKVQALTENDLKTFTFNYTMTDADGDEDTAVLTIKIQGAKDGSTVETAKITGADDVVYESGLSPDGTEAATDKEIATNTFDISSTDGIKNIVIGGDTFTLAEIKTLATTNQTVDTGEGTLKLTGFTGDDFAGTVSYEYTLKATIDNDSKQGATDTRFDDKLTITVNGIGGTTASDELVVRIMDDAPEAKNDTTTTLVENAPVIKVDGQVLDNDKSGADAPKDFVSWDIANDPDVAELNTYGTLKLNADGTYEFVLDNSLPKVDALKDTDLKTFNFNYTMKDADGDEDTAVLTIKIQGKTDAISIDVDNVQVDEDFIPNLGNATNPDTDNVANQNVDTGNITTVGADTVEFKAGQTTTLTSESNAITLDYSNSGKTITGMSNGEEVFVATIAADGKSYTFELKGQVDHPVMNSEDTVNLPLVIEVSNSEKTITDTLNVTIADDIPTAEDAAATVDLNANPVNLVFTLDISGSMGSNTDGKLADAVDAIKKVVAEYEAQGNPVQIQLNTFHTTADTPVNGWMDSATLTTELDKLSKKSWTNYEDALDRTEDNYTPPLNGGKTYIYFLSDGVPTVEMDDSTPLILDDVTAGNAQDGIDGSTNDTGFIDADRLAAWNSFVNDPLHNIAEVFAVGIEMNSDKYLKLVDSDADIVDSDNLAAVLVNTVVNVSGDLDFSYGADGEADGTGAKLDAGKLAFTWGDADSSNNLDEVTTTGTNSTISWTLTNGTLLVGTIAGNVVVKVQATGLDTSNPGFKITEFDKTAGIESLKVPYTIIDGDGDSTTANLDIKIDLGVVADDDIIEVCNTNDGYEAYAYNGNNFINGNLGKTDVSIGNASLSGNPSNQQVTDQDLGIGIFGNVNNGNSGVSDSQGIDDDETLVLKFNEPQTSVEFEINTDLGTENIQGSWTLFDANGDQISVNTSFTITASGTVVLTAENGQEFQYASFEGHTSGDVGASDAGFYIKPLDVTITSTYAYEDGVTVDTANNSVTMTQSKLLENDSDLDGTNGDLFISSVSQTAEELLEGTAVLNPDGSVTYTRTDDFDGIATFTYTLEDEDGNTDIAVVTIDGEECMVEAKPNSYNETNTLVFGAATTNLLFTIDISGSMDNQVTDSNGNTITRYELALESIVDTIEAYEANGVTNVNLTFFSTNSTNEGWMNSADAKAFLNNLLQTSDGSGRTDYYDALNATMGVDFTGYDADQNIAYFLSDGKPNDNSSKIDQDSDQTIKDWKTYVDTNIDKLNVIGVGSGAVKSSLEIIQVESSNKVIMVTDESTLGNVLAGTVTASVNGNVLENISGGDGSISIDSIEVYGQTYTSSNYPTGGIVLDGDGKLSFNFTNGDYTYTAKSSEFSADESKMFKVNASDEDGDVTSLDVTLDIDVLPTNTENIIDLSDTDTIDLVSALTNHSTTPVDGVDMTDGKSNNLNIDLDDIIILDDDPELDELKIFGENGDKVTLEGGDANWTNSGKTEIDGEVFNVYEGTNGSSNIKVLIDEDVSIEPDL